MKTSIVEVGGELLPKHACVPQDPSGEAMTLRTGIAITLAGAINTRRICNI